MKIPMFPGISHQNGGFSMAMLVYQSVVRLGRCHFCLCFFLGGGVKELLVESVEPANMVVAAVVDG